MMTDKDCEQRRWDFETLAKRCLEACVAIESLTLKDMGREDVPGYLISAVRSLEYAAQDLERAAKATAPWVDGRKESELKLRSVS